MNAIWDRIKNEPVLAVTLVTAVIGLAVAFGVDVNDEAKAAIITAVGAVLALVARRKVTPV